LILLKRFPRTPTKIKYNTPNDINLEQHNHNLETKSHSKRILITRLGKRSGVRNIPESHWGNSETFFKSFEFTIQIVGVIDSPTKIDMKNMRKIESYQSGVMHYIYTQFVLRKKYSHSLTIGQVDIT